MCKVSNWKVFHRLTLPMQTRGAKQNLSQVLIMIDLADVCADMSVLADTNAARTTARVLCTSE